jgi:hypothetical protein
LWLEGVSDPRGEHPASCTCAEEAEACAILFGLETAAKQHLSIDVLESDCVVAVKVVQQECKNLSRFWHVYDGIKDMLGSSQSCNIQHISRKDNSVAHELANLAKKSNSSLLWLAPVPGFISDLCNSDIVKDSTLIE